MMRRNTEVSAHLSGLLAGVPVYRNARVIQDHALHLIQNCPSLVPSLDTLINNDGSSSKLLLLQGTIPITYNGATYNIPVKIWITAQYPVSSPLIFVTPTTGMMIKPQHKHVGLDGMCYFPYLNEWRSNTSNLTELVLQAQHFFGLDPPVYAKKTTSQATASASNSSNAGEYQQHQQHQQHQQPLYQPQQPHNQQQQPNPYQPPQPQQVPPSYPPAYPTTQSSQSPYAPPQPHYQPPYGPPSSGGSQGQQPSTQPTYNGSGHQPLYQPSSTPPPVQPQPPYSAGSSQSTLPQTQPLAQPQPPSPAQPAVGDVGRPFPALSITREDPLSVLKQEVTTKVNSAIAPILLAAEEESAEHKHSLQQLTAAVSKLRAEVDSAQSEKTQLEQEVASLNAKDESLKSWLEEARVDSQCRSVEDVLLPSDALTRQLFTVIAKDAAIGDALACLDTALEEKVVELPFYLSETRKLSREQFLARALCGKIVMKRRELNLP